MIHFDLEFVAQVFSAVCQALVVSGKACSLGDDLLQARHKVATLDRETKRVTIRLPHMVSKREAK